jgi:uncharacterized protein (TIGR03086 family)
MPNVADRYRKVAAGFTERVAKVPDDRWTNPSPCEDWTARDVVQHMVDASGLFLGFVGVSAGDGPSVADDPLAAWERARDAVQSALDDPAIAATEYDGFGGRSTFEAGINRFLLPDVLVHTWDLARATGLDETLDAEEVETMNAAVATIEDDSFMRQPGVFGPRIDVPDDADAQTQYLAFTGRRA